MGSLRITITAMMLLASTDIVAGRFPLFDHQGKDLVSALAVKEKHHKRGLGSVCQSPDLTPHYFEVMIRLEADKVPDGTSNSICELADQIFLGNDLNQLLSNFGIGDTGLDNDLIKSDAFVAAICPQPHTVRRRSTLQSPNERHLQFGGWSFRFYGGGGCKLCTGGRQSLRGGIVGEDATTNAITMQRELQSNRDWFASIYAPEMEASMEAAILEQLVPNHGACLGMLPFVEVQLQQMTLDDLHLSCDDDGTVLESLKSMSHTDTTIKAHDCSNCKSIDFSTKGSDSSSTPLIKGDYLRDEWKVSDGLTILARGGYSPNSMARVFDTADTECIAADGTHDFGSPNQSCQGGEGIGEGSGGMTGTLGANCVPIGNVLIIQNTNKDCPDASTLGGALKFKWDKPVMVSDVV